MVQSNIYEAKFVVTRLSFLLANKFFSIDITTLVYDLGEEAQVHGMVGI